MLRVGAGTPFASCSRVRGAAGKKMSAFWPAWSPLCLFDSEWSRYKGWGHGARDIVMPECV